MKRTKIKEVRYSREELERVAELSEKHGTSIAAYIRERALKNKILVCLSDEKLKSCNRYLADYSRTLNDIARAVNTDKAVFESDFIEMKKRFGKFSKCIFKEFPDFTFEEL